MFYRIDILSHQCFIAAPATLDILCAAAHKAKLATPTERAFVADRAPLTSGHEPLYEVANPLIAGDWLSV